MYQHPGHYWHHSGPLLTTIIDLPVSFSSHNNHYPDLILLGFELSINGIMQDLFVCLPSFIQHSICELPQSCCL